MVRLAKLVERRTVDIEIWVRFPPVCLFTCITFLFRPYILIIRYFILKETTSTHNKFIGLFFINIQ